jgi:uncharacterized protein
LFIEVNRIPPEGLEVDQALDLQPVTLDGAPAPVERVKIAGMFRRSRVEVVFRGSVEAVVDLICSRCAAPLSLEVAGDCSRLYRAGNIGQPVSEGDLDEDDLALTPYDGFRIELDEIAREQIYLLLPLRPLCIESCAGLCPRCGADLNLAPCGCPEDLEGKDPLTLKIPL